MSTILLLIQYIPQIINIVKKIKAMSDDGLSKQEIERALNKIELAFDDISDDNALASELDDQWMRNTEQEGKVPPPLPTDTTTKSEA